MDPQTKLHQFQAYNSVLSAENAQILKAAVDNDENTMVQASFCKLGHQSCKQIQFLARKEWVGQKAQATLSKKTMM